MTQLKMKYICTQIVGDAEMRNWDNFVSLYLGPTLLSLSCMIYYTSWFEIATSFIEMSAAEKNEKREGARMGFFQKVGGPFLLLPFANPSLFSSLISE